MNTHCDKRECIIDADCLHEEGRFHMHRLPGCLPNVFTVRFVAPADFTAGDVIVVNDVEMPVKTPGMTDAGDGLFSKGAVLHCEIDLGRKLAFISSGFGASTSVSCGDHVHPTDITRVPVERIISTTAPLTGGGDLSGDRTLGISPATAATETSAGAAGSVVYAPDNAGPTIRDQAATPAMVHGVVGAPTNAWLVPNGGTLQNPTAIKLNSRYIISSPWPGYKVKCEMQALVSGVWGDIPHVDDQGGSLSHGVTASQLGSDKIVIQTSNNSLLIESVRSGHPFGDNVRINDNLQCRIYCEKGGALP